MTDKIKTAFESIHAEDALKLKTKEYIQIEIKRRERTRGRAVFRRYAAAVASIVILLFLGLSAHNIYYTASAYVDVDVNPSIELIINRFDLVIGIKAYNQEGEELIEAVDIKHKNYSDAIGILIDLMVQNGYAQDDSLISVTLQSDDEETDSVMLSNIETAVREHHGSAVLEAFSVDSEVKDAAQELELSPAKYLAIQDLIEVDPEASMEGCRNHSIEEIKHLTEVHSGWRHGADTDNGECRGGQDAPEENDCRDTEATPQDTGCRYDRNVQENLPEDSENQGNTPQNNGSAHHGGQGNGHHWGW